MRLHTAVIAAKYWTPSGEGRELVIVNLLMSYDLVSSKDRGPENPGVIKNR